MAGPSEAELHACLKDHGADVPKGDARALKRWIVEHQDDAAAADAMKACDLAPVTKAAEVRCAKVVGPGASGDDAKRKLEAGTEDAQGDRGLTSSGD
jgi:hypothetical protein